MAVRGQRFTLDLSDDEDETGSSSRIPSNPASSIPGAFIGDVQERASTAPPTAPRLKTTTSGFPEHKKRTRVSAFKQQRGSSSHQPEPRYQAAPPASGERTERTLGDDDRKRIDEENRRRLESMSAEEIDEERQELLSGLNPSLIERLLKRANLDDGRGDTGTEKPQETQDEDVEGEEAKPVKEVEGAVAAPNPTGKPVAAAKGVRFEEDEPPNEPIDLRPVFEVPNADISELALPSIHFPTAPSAPDLDPSDPEFFESLHTKYFPDLPADPSKLAWMAPIPTHGSIADQESPYYPGQDGLPVSAIRFGFKGGMLPPRIARAVPVTKGLHHHGEAPEAAGYTIPELARLSRSAFPAQRCMAFQTLGRILYRLGRGNFGAQDGDLAKGLWKGLEEGKVIQTLEEAVSAEGGHQGSKSHAITALWLWHKGGGKVWKAT
jgi:hypothetical protein